MDLEDKSALVLATLETVSDLDTKTIQDIISIIGDTEIASHLTYYQDALDFHEEHKRYPEYSYLKSKYPTLNLSLITVPSEPSLDLITEFLRELKGQHRHLQVSLAIQQRDYDSAKVLMEQDSTKEVVEQFGIESVVQSYEELISQPSGILTGVSEVDNALKGLSYGTVTVIAAPPACFKTTYALSILYKAVFQNGFNFIYMGLEGLSRDTWYSLISRHSLEMGKPLPAEKIKKGLLTLEEKEVLKEVVQDWQANCKGALHVVSPSDIEDFSISQFHYWMKMMDKKTPIDGLIVDHIQLLKFYRVKGIQRGDDLINFYVNYFRALAIGFMSRGLITILLSQLNRVSWQSLHRGKRANLFSFAESNELERAAHAAIVLYASDAEKASNQFRAQVVKNRSGPITEEMTLQFIDPIHYKAGDDTFNATFTAGALDLIGDDATAPFGI